MTDPDDRQPRRAAQRLRAAALWCALLLLLLAVALWVVRKPVATRFVDDALAQRGVPARYQITRIGLRTQRLTNVSIGDPAHPDLIADWIEVDTSVWISGVRVTGLRAGHVRARAALQDGRLSFGALDRLLPTTGKAFALPAIYTDIADARIALTTPQGPVALTLRGKGQLDNGFSGVVTAQAQRLLAGNCEISDAKARLSLEVAHRKPYLRGPLQVARTRCSGMAVDNAGADINMALTPTLNGVSGNAQIALAALRAGDTLVRAVGGSITVKGTAADLSGQANLRSGAIAAIGARGAGLHLASTYRYARGTLRLAGRARAEGLALPSSLTSALAKYRTAAAGTPVGPIVEKLVVVLTGAARSGTWATDFSSTISGTSGRILLSRLAFAAPTGVRGGLEGAVAYGWPNGLMQLSGRATLGGGGAPEVQAELAQAAPGGPITGHVLMAPYAAGTARLALSPIDFTASPTGATRITTRVVLSGPIGDGHIEALTLPVTAIWDGRNRLIVNPGCAPLSFASLRLSGLMLRRSGVTLCPIDGALLRLAGASRGGGAMIGPMRLAGTLGTSPIELTSRRTELSLAQMKIAVQGLGVRLGTAARLSRLDIDRLTGTLGQQSSGRFTGGSGQIGNVPLLLSSAAGNWRLLAGRLAVDGAMTVADAAAEPRFNPVAARDVSLMVSGNDITATGRVFEPVQGALIANVTIAHELSGGTGHADLAVPGITFGENFQPDRLTRLTYGVIANVAGTISGTGHIFWTPQGVTSDGVFGTTNIDLAAAFGPVTGIRGEIHFTDLLALQSAAGQMATIATINPGIPVNNGTITYQTLPNAQIKVEGARWPFAGGALTLEPTLLDFGEAQKRRMTFRVTGMAADQFLQQFDFKNLDVTGVFDGVLPMVFDASGGRIEDGHLRARAEGGKVAYVGEISQKDLGFWGNLAFQSLKSLRYQNLDITMNGALAGEMVTEVHFAGVKQGAEAKRNFILDRLQKLPLVFNVTIKAPFRQLIDSAQSFYDPQRLIERNLPALLEEQNRRTAPTPAPTPAPPLPIQPPDSRIVP